jgi:hypothetical protein
VFSRQVRRVVPVPKKRFVQQLSLLPMNKLKGVDDALRLTLGLRVTGLDSLHGMCMLMCRISQPHRWSKPCRRIWPLTIFF